MKPLDRVGPVVVAVSCKDPLEGPARRYADIISASELITIHEPGLIDARRVRALARAGADQLRASNDRTVEKHLLIRGPVALAAMIGAASNACGSVVAPFWDGTQYVSPLEVGR